MTRTRETLLAGAAIVVLTIFVTWPQCWYLGTRVAVHDDSYFSMWRLAWIAHALATDPRHLFDASTFRRARGTLAFSDATLFDGLLGAPLLWANISPVVVYNLRQTTKRRRSRRPHGTRLTTNHDAIYVA